MTKNSSKIDVPYIHVVRAVACLSVVALHCTTINCEVYSIDAYFSRIIFLLTRSCVPLFLMISGALLLPYNRNYSLKDFYIKRLSKILYPLVFWGGYILYYLTY